MSLPDLRPGSLRAAWSIRFAACAFFRRLATRCDFCNIALVVKGIYYRYTHKIVLNRGERRARRGQSCVTRPVRPPRPSHPGRKGLSRGRPACRRHTASSAPLRTARQHDLASNRWLAWGACLHVLHYRQARAREGLRRGRMGDGTCARRASRGSCDGRDGRAGLRAAARATPLSWDAAPFARRSESEPGRPGLPRGLHPIARMPPVTGRENRLCISTDTGHGVFSSKSGSAFHDMAHSRGSG